jgi:hypothetical protein
MEEEVEVCLEDVVNELKRIADRVRYISDELWEYGQSDSFILRFSEIFNDEEKKELQRLSWKAEYAVWELYKMLEKRIEELEKKIGGEDESETHNGKNINKGLR